MSDLIGRVVSSRNRSPGRSPVYAGTQVVEQKQVIEAGEGSKVYDNRQSQTQSVTIVTSLPKFFFDLKVFKASIDQAQTPVWEPLDIPLRLEAGHEYQIEASTSPNESYVSNENYELKQWPVVIPFKMDVYLRPSKVIPALTISNALGTVIPGEESYNFHHTFLLTVDPECPFDSLDLELLYNEKGVEKRAARLPIILEGSYNEPDKELWTRIGIDESMRPPTTMALLRVEAAELGKLRLSCWNRRPFPTRPNFLKPIEQPKLGLEALEQDIHNPKAVQAIIDKISDFFAVRVPQLSEWLSYLLEQHQDQSCVVIVDETTANVPWEMLEIDDGKYLGAQANVVRWTEAQYRRLRAILSLQDREQHVGSMLAYVHCEDHAQAIQESPILNYLTSEIYTSEEALRSHLSLQGMSQVGLIYLRYRGSFRYGNEPDEILQLLNSPYGEPVQIRFTGVVAPIDKRPVVFVNACHSARIFWDGDDSYGLVKILLAKFAAAYIGTIGSVEPSFAAQFAQRILQEAGTMTNGVTLAELLRLFRQEAVNKYLQNSLEPLNKIALIHAFMYVYYGNPYARLRLMSEPVEGMQQGQKDDR